MARQIKSTKLVDRTRRRVSMSPSSGVMNGLGDRSGTNVRSADNTGIVIQAAKQFMGGVSNIYDEMHKDYVQEQRTAGTLAALQGKEISEEASDYKINAYDVSKAQVDSYEFQVALDDYTSKAIESSMSPADFDAGVKKSIANYISGKSDQYIMGFQPTASQTAAKAQIAYGNGVMKKLQDNQKNDIRIKTAGVIRNLEAEGHDLTQGNILRQVAKLLQEQYSGDDTIKSREELFAGGLNQIVGMDKDSVDNEVIETIRSYAIETGQPDILEGLNKYVDKTSGFSYGTSRYGDRIRSGISQASTVADRRNIDTKFDGLMGSNMTADGSVRYDLIMKNLGNYKFLKENDISSTEALKLRNMASTAWSQSLKLKEEADRDNALKAMDSIYDLYSGGSVTEAIKMLNDDDNIPANKKFTMLKQLQLEVGDDGEYDVLLRGIREGRITNPVTVLTNPNITVKQSQELRKVIEEIQKPDGEVLKDGLKAIRDGIAGGAFIKQTPLQATNIQRASADLRKMIEMWREEGKDPTMEMQDGTVVKRLLDKYTPDLQAQLDSKLASIRQGQKPQPNSFTSMRGYMRAYLKSRGAPYDDRAVDKAFDNDATRTYIEGQWSRRGDM